MNRIFGQQGEQAARAYLIKQGYRPLASNFSTRWGEIDLVMEHGGVIVFVEVKNRRHDHYGLPEEAVTPLKQRHVLYAAHLFLQKRKLTGRNIRFDIVSIEAGQIRHLPAAFITNGEFYC